jgi:small subunit ribosomal protein S1
MVENAVELVEEKETSEAPSTPSAISELEPKLVVNGTVTRLELYGAFVDIGVGSNAILHISKLGKRVNRVSDVLAIGDEISAWVETVDPGREQVTLTMIEPLAVDWGDLKEGQVYNGTITRIEKYGVFVDIGAEKEGLVHISELSHEYVKHPSEAVKDGEEIQVKVIGFNRRKRRIDLSRKSLLNSPEAEVEEIEEFDPEEEEIELPTAMEIALKRAMTETGEEEKPSGRTAYRAKTNREKQDALLERTLRMSQEGAE